MDEPDYNRSQRRIAEKLIKKEFGKALPNKIEHAPPSLDKLYELADEAHQGKFDTIPFAKKVRAMLEEKFCDEPQNSAFAQRMYREYVQGRTFEESWVALYYVSLIIFHVGRDLDKQQKMRSDVIPKEQISFTPIDALILEFAKNAFTNYTPASRKVYLEWIKQIDILPLHSMFECLDVWMVNFHAWTQVAEKIKKYMIDELHVSSGDAIELKRSTDELFHGLKQLQRYTIKQSCYTDESGIAPISGWVCIDPLQIRNAEQLSRTELAIVNLSNDCMAEYVPFREESGMYGITASHFTDGNKIGTNYSFDALTGLKCKVGHDGELYYFVYPIKISLRDIYKKCGMEAQYEFMRFQFIARLFDLLVPREISEQTPSMDGLAERMRHARSERPDVRPMQILRDLITPRKYILRDKEGMKKALAREEEGRNEQDSVNEDQKIRHQFFGRVGHPMQLRTGYRPHSDAKKWAKEDGFWRELEDNETWCRPIDSPVPVVHRQKGPGEKRKDGE